MKRFFSFLMTITPLLSMAHPGHGEHSHGNSGGFTITHYFTEAEHAIPLGVTVLVLIVIAFRYFNQHKERNKA
jgi:hypothetical protein